MGFRKIVLARQIGEDFPLKWLQALYNTLRGLSPAAVDDDDIVLALRLLMGDECAGQLNQN